VLKGAEKNKLYLEKQKPDDKYNPELEKASRQQDHAAKSQISKLVGDWCWKVKVVEWSDERIPLCQAFNVEGPNNN